MNNGYVGWSPDYASDPLRAAKAALSTERGPLGVFETIVDEIIKHDEEHPDHGVGCSCHDKHAGTLRRLLSEKKLTFRDGGREKSLRNLLVVLGYVTRNP